MLARLLKIHPYSARWLRVYLRLDGEAVLMWEPVVCDPEHYKQLEERL